MEREETYRKHPFELVIETKPLTLPEMMSLAECVDSFEIAEGIRDHVVVDVLETLCESTTVIVTPREALTYEVMRKLVEALVARAAGAIGKKFVRLAGVRWRIERAGISSNLHSQQFI